jgi:hypothetical protein
MASYKPSKIKRSSPCHRRWNLHRRGQHPGRLSVAGGSWDARHDPHEDPIAGDATARGRDQRSELC